MHLPLRISSLSHTACVVFISGLAQDADVLVHEATNTFLPGVDKDGSVRAVTRDAKIHGHSTPFMVRAQYSPFLHVI